MKASKTGHNGTENGSLTIPEAEEIIEDALNELAYSPDPGLARELRFLAPPGYQAIVELCSENGRSKRRNALADNWSAEEDEVRIYFERVSDGDEMPRPSRAPRAAAGPAPEDEDDPHAETPPDEIDSRIHDLCETLAEAERGGHAFIALKWFRDSFLPRKTFRWNRHAEMRQAVLAEAIQRGAVLTSKIANPKTPAYPTTTIRLNRAEAGIAEEELRYQPVTVHGDAISEAIEEERGNE